MHVVAPVADAHEPAAQDVQLAAPAAEYEPAAHGAHVAEEVALVALEDVPAAQAVQDDAEAAA